MPELPDVETYRSHLAHTVLHQKIDKVEIKETDILSSSKSTLYSLKGESFEDTGRHGKYCFLELSGGRFLVLHFGMTGEIRYYQEDEEDPEYGAVIFQLGNDHRFAFINIRKLGDISVEKDINEFIRKKELGPDALSISKDDFVNLIKAKRGKIKTALMDQKAFSGVGNVYADEILYHAGFRPEKKTGDLEEDDIGKIYDTMQEVLETAIDSKANPGQMPRNYLIRRREDGASCGVGAGTIKKIKVNGRGTYYCPNHQK